MPTFAYSARALNGEILSGEVELPTREEVVGYLVRQRLRPISVNTKAKELNFTIGTGIKTREVVIFTRQFATMINAGLPLVQSLTILAQQTENKTLKDVTKAVVYDVEAGNTLADPLAQPPKALTGLYVNMVAAGEAGGILDTILMRLGTFMEKNDALVRKVKGAMIYPSVIMGVAGIAVTVLLIFVIPVFENLFNSAGLALPLPTRIVMGASRFLKGYWYMVI